MIENTGKTIKQHLVKSDPFKETKCSDINCPICISNSGINCKMRDVVYEQGCEDIETCDGRYVGETSDSINERTCEHKDKCRLKSKDSALYKHILEKHDGDQKDISVKILGRCPNDPMLRQCMESVAIRDTNPNMNLKEEWGNKKNTRHPMT